MDIPCYHCGALRRHVEETRKSTCCSSGRAMLPDIHEAHGPMRPLLGGAIEASVDSHRDVRIYTSTLSFASVGSHCDLTTMNRHGAFVVRIRGPTYRMIGPLGNKEGPPEVCGDMHLRYRSIQFRSGIHHRSARTATRACWGARCDGPFQSAHQTLPRLRCANAYVRSRNGVPYGRRRPR